MYEPSPNSEYRVKFDFRVDFTNGGYVEGHDFLLDVEGDDVSEADLKVMIVESMNLAKAGEVRIYGSTVFNGTTLFNHKGHDGHKGKTYESKTLFSLCVLGALCGEALSR